VDSHTFTTVKAIVLEQGRAVAVVHAQIEGIAFKETREGKPFYEFALVDAGAKLTLRVWSDSPAFASCGQFCPGDFIAIDGEFTHSPQFGLEAKRWEARRLTDSERDLLLGGTTAVREKQAVDFDYIQKALSSIADPRLSGICQIFLVEFGERFRRAAAARTYHHARRGGLVEHVAQMMRNAEGLCGAYPALNRDLLLTGVLFHDSGKLWENNLPPDSFTMPFDERGELLGHITIGIELINTLWRKIMASEPATTWKELQPANEDVRLHLLHLIAAHHGELQFGSPVPPKTPEAWALHYIDNLDAKMEMITAAYANAKPLAARIRERTFPLPGNEVLPLPKFRAEAGEVSA
jgi:3'-5' exoribonuclease